MRISFYFIIMLALLSCNSNTEINKETLNEDLGKFKDDWTFEFFMIAPEKNVFRLWVPKNIKPKAIMVLAPGNAGDGTDLVKLKHWQEYAEKEELILMGVFVRSDMEGSASRLLKALEIISKQNKLEGVSNLPILLRGFSHGGVFSYTFSQLYKDRVLAFANIKGNLFEVENRMPPGLFISGEKDLETRNASIKKAFLSQREKKGIACYALEPEVGHDVGNSDDLVKSFFKSVLDKRLSGQNIISVINEEEIYLGDNSSFSVFEFSNYLKEKKEASCILDLEFGSSWKEFSQ